MEPVAVSPALLSLLQRLVEAATDHRARQGHLIDAKALDAAMLAVEDEVAADRIRRRTTGLEDAETRLRGGDRHTA